MANRALTNALSLARSVFREVAKAQRSASRKPKPKPRPPGRATAGRRAPSRASRGNDASGYAGDFRGNPHISYAPVADDLPDPGEVVWTWVPYEEDYSQGKDRPVLVIGRHEGLLLALQLTSKDHDRDAEQEARSGRFWIDVGTGEWDRERRPSEARVNRILQLDPGAVRRIGAVLPEPVFAEVAAEVKRRAGRYSAHRRIRFRFRRWALLGYSEP
ncbi:MAG: type II toxin-antitoxin system PemK/MazF family toxin [Ornithinimicrobium sp.]